MAEEDLQLGSSDEKGALYTYPKFAGVAFLNDVVANKKIPLLFKVKVVTKEGNGSFSYSSQDIGNLDPTTPVIVFEMIATDEGLSYLECHEIAKRCFNHSRRNLRSKDRHKESERCRFCCPKQVDVTPFKEKFQPILERADEMLLALGADFVLQKQQSFVRFFSDKAKFPQLTELFARTIPSIQKFFLARNQPLNMTVSHVYTDCASYAAKRDLVIDAPYDRQLKARGLI